MSVLVSKETFVCRFVFVEIYTKRARLASVHFAELKKIKILKHI